MSKKSLLFGVLAIAMSVLLVWQVRVQSFNWAMDELRLEGEHRLLNTVVVFRQAIDKYHYLPFLISQNQDIQTLLKAPSLPKGEAMSRYLEQINLVAQASQTMVIDLNGNALSFSGWRDKTALFMQNYAHEAYFKSALNKERGVFLLPQEGLPLSFYLTAPIYHQASLNGIALVRVGLDKLQPALQSLGSYYVTGPKGKILLSNQPSWIELNQVQVFKPQAPILLSSQQALELVSEVTNKGPYLRQSVELSDLGVTMTVLSDTKPVFRVRDNMTVVSLVVCITLLLMMMVLRERHLKNRSRAETREVLAANEQQQRAIINNAQVGLLTLDNSGRIRFVNTTLAKQFDTTSELLVGTPLRHYVRFEDHSEVKASLGSLTLAPQSFIATVAAEVAICASRSFPALISIQQFENDGRYLITIIDITKRKNLEAQLQQINDQLEEKVIARTQALETAQAELVQSEKMAALGRMSSAMVHELNQPLTAIRTYTSICRQLLAQEAYSPLQENLDVVNQLTQRMAQMTTQLKAFAFKKPSELSPISVSNLVHQLVMQTQPTLPDWLELRFDCPSQAAALRVLGDSARISHVMTNLISNGVDTNKEAYNEASKNRGQTERRTLLVSLEPLMVEQHSWLQIRVTDEGVGISATSMDHLFDPFFTTKAIGEGLGLGLSIVATIVRDLGGSINAENNESGVGACFTVRLPCA